jgi:hypothetical protein
MKCQLCKQQKWVITLSKKKTREDKISEADLEDTTSIAMTVDGVKAEEKLKVGLVF